MATTSFQTFLPDVMQHCPDVLDAVALNALRNASIEFLEKTHWLQYTVPPVTVTGGVSSYPIALPSQTTLVRLQSAFYDDFPLVPMSEEQLRALFVATDWQEATGVPRYYLRDQDDPTSIILVPQPQITETGALNVVAVIRPTHAATTISADVYEKWGEQIAAGAVARLMRTPGQAYTNQSVAARFDALYRSGISDAKIDRNRSLERTKLSVRYPRFV